MVSLMIDTIILTKCSLEHDHEAQNWRESVHFRTNVCRCILYSTIGVCISARRSLNLIFRRFMHKNELDQMYLDEIAQFIIKNTSTPTLEAGLPQVCALCVSRLSNLMIASYSVLSTRILAAARTCLKTQAHNCLQQDLWIHLLAVVHTKLLRTQLGI